MCCAGFPGFTCCVPFQDPMLISPNSQWYPLFVCWETILERSRCKQKESALLLWTNAEDFARWTNHQRIWRMDIVWISDSPITLLVREFQDFDEEFTAPSKIMSLDQSLTIISWCGLYPSISICLFPELPRVVSHFSSCPSIFSSSFMHVSTITMIANSSPYSLTTALHPRWSLLDKSGTTTYREDSHFIPSTALNFQTPHRIPEMHGHNSALALNTMFRFREFFPSHNLRWPPFCAIDCSCSFSTFCLNIEPITRSGSSYTSSLYPFNCISSYLIQDALLCCSSRCGCWHRICCVYYYD